MSYILRDATLADVEAIVELGSAMHAESPQWSRLVYSRERMALTLRAIIGDVLSLLKVAEEAGQIVGGVMAVARTHWSSNDLVAQEMALFVSPDQRGTSIAVRLVRALSTWAYNIGAVLLQAGASTGVQDTRTAILYERLGFAPGSIGVERFYGR